MAGTRTENMNINEVLTMIEQASVNIREGISTAVEEGSAIHLAMESIVHNGEMLKEKCSHVWDTTFDRVLRSATNGGADTDKIEQALELGREAYKRGRSNIPAQNQQLMKMLEGSPLGGIGVALMEAYNEGWNEARNKDNEQA